MAEKTTKKPRKLLTGVEGKRFGTEQAQPSPESKKIGWEKWRAKKMLTQAIVKKMSTGKNLDEYIKSLIENAKAGNAKAIETINKGIEDQIDKSEVKHETTAPIIIEWTKQ